MKAEEHNTLAEAIRAMIARFCEINSDLQDPKVLVSPHLMTALMKERCKLLKIVEPGMKWSEMMSRVEEARGIISSPDSDTELLALAKADAEEASAAAAEVFEKIREIILTQEELGERNVIVEIRAGTGGDEAGLFAADLFRMYQRYAESRKWTVDIVYASQTGLGGLKEVVFSVEGDGVFGRLRFESGGHRVQRVPETEASGRIHTSACTVAVLPEPEEVEIQLRTEDIKVDTYRAGGPGGQKVNKTSSAVRMTHIPTGVVVQCQDDKSQHKNRAKALKVLKTRIFEFEQKKKDDARSRERKTQIGSGDRSERVRTYNFPQNRVTDHRIKMNFTLQTVIGGDLDDLFDALEETRKAELMSSFEKGLV